MVTIKREEIQNVWDSALMKEMTGTWRQPDPNQEGDQRALCERYATATSRKGMGTNGIMDWLVRDVSEEIKLWRHAILSGGHIILKCDTKNAMIAFRNAVARFRECVVASESPARSEKSHRERIYERFQNSSGGNGRRRNCE